jgi:glycosyltransferase involved in cell wall biosynthesis
MDDRIKILFHNKDAAGVNYFRTNTPAVQLERDHSDKFQVEINSDLDFNDPSAVEYLKSFHIINYHRQLIGGVDNMIRLKNELNAAGVTLIMDIDDYWHLDKTHPFYRASIDQKLHQDIVDNLKLADFVTTTSDLFASEIRKITGKDNVMVFPNSVDPTWMKQFRDKRKPSEDGLVRISYMAGSSHMNDVQQLVGAINRLEADKQTKGKFKVIIAGWDTQGTTTDVKFNEDFSKELQKRRLWDRKMVKAINKSGGNIDLIPNVPADLIEKYRDNVFHNNKRDIHSEESVYLEYEKILTNNHGIIQDTEYLKWLGKYERDTYSNENRFARRWTRKANIYAEVLNETDISIAPLADNKFNTMKSNLKQVECWSRKIPVVTSDIAPYNVDGVNGENCVLVPLKKNTDKYWYKALKKLILDEELRNKIGQGLYDTFSEKYNLKNVTDNRAKFYESVIHEALKV